MSHDLFAAFGVPEPEHDSHDLRQSPGQSQWESFTNLGKPTEAPLHDAQKDLVDTDHGGADEDDDFGEFENAASSPPRFQQDVTKPSASPIPAKNFSQILQKSSQAETSVSKDPRIGKHPFAAHMDLLFSGGDGEYDAGADDLEDLSRNPEAAMAYSKRVVEGRLEQRSQSEQQRASQLDSGLHVTSEATSIAHQNSQPHSPRRPRKDPNVLFDVDDVTDESEQDDFGDFEDAHAPSVSVAHSPKSSRVEDQAAVPDIDLLGLNDNAPLSGSSEPRRADVARKSIPSVTSRHLDNSGLVSSFSAQASNDADEAWDDFDEAEPAPERSIADTATPLATIVAITPKRDRESQRRDQENSSPPTNIPPPVILLSIFASIFATAREVLLDPLSKLEPAERQQLLAHPATIQFLRNYLVTAMVLGHIIAGRKSRWKRDQYLAQSMRIGPASAGGRGGMKLTGLDKSEAAKEDREVLDAVRLWKAQVGKLRGAVTTASSSKTPAAQTLPPVPEIADPIPVKTLKAVQGGFTAPHGCALCGLKREERVAKIDIDINDSFGEWWLDGMSMHLICRNFWIEHKDKLKSR